MSLSIEMLNAQGFVYTVGDVILRHNHKGFFQAFIVLEGKAEMIHISEKLVMPKHTILIVCPKEDHYMPPLKSEGCKMLDLKFTVTDSNLFLLVRNLSGMHSIDEIYLQQMLEMAWNEAYEKLEYSSSIICDILEILFYKLDRKMNQIYTSGNSDEGMDHIIDNRSSIKYSMLSTCTRRTLKYIEGQILENSTFNLDNVAKALGYNKSYMSRCFSNEIGISITQYRSLLRIDKAKELLRETRASVAEIATHLGYDSASSFVKIFKQYTGLSPSDYRKSGPSFGDHGFKYGFRNPKPDDTK